MLKNEEFIYESDDFNIIYPNSDLRKVIIKEMESYTDKDGNLDLDNSKFKLYLFQTLVSSNDLEYQFNAMEIKDLEDIEKNPSLEFEMIEYFIGSIISDLIISTYRSKILELKQTQIQMLQNESLKMVEDITNDLMSLAKNEKRIEDEKRINEIRKEKGLDKIEEELNNPKKRKWFNKNK